MIDSSHHNPSPLANIFAALIILIHLAVTLFALDLYDLSRDEARYWEVSSRTIGGMIEWSAADNYPPLLFILMAAWRPIFGESEAGLRFPFAIFSALALFVFWRILRRKPWLPPEDAVWVLALVAFSPMQIFIATLAKYYTLLELLGLMFWFGMEQLMESRHSNAGVPPAGREGRTGVLPVSSEGGIGVSPVPSDPSGLSARDRRDAYPPLKEADKELAKDDGFGILEGKRHARLRTAVVLVALAMIYLHYLGFVIIASFLLAAILISGWPSIWNVVRQFKLRALIFLLYLPWFVVFLNRTWANLGETSELADERGGGTLRHLGGLLATPYGLFWGNSLEPWHFGLVGISMILILGALFFFARQIFQKDDPATAHAPVISIRFLWLFVILSFVFTFLIITFFMRIPILFYAERFTFILPFFIAAILLSWPRRWRRPVFAISLCLFLFANYNFLAKRECLNWSYSIPWREMVAELKLEEVEKNQTLHTIIFDCKSFGALGEYYLPRSFICMGGLDWLNVDRVVVVEHDEDRLKLDYNLGTGRYLIVFSDQNDWRSMPISGGLILIYYAFQHRDYDQFQAADNVMNQHLFLQNDLQYVKDSLNYALLKKKIKQGDQPGDYNIIIKKYQ